mmetsp:Transcript_37387/g.86941  ORF Transcript_37387/g.86941 Transcript_37387/m.86941 type:complete len:140 (+) Transcript_37387:150-569(+)
MGQRIRHGSGHGTRVAGAPCRVSLGRSGAQYGQLEVASYNGQGLVGSAKPPPRKLHKKCAIHHMGRIEISQPSWVKGSAGRSCISDEFKKDVYSKPRCETKPLPGAPTTVDFSVELLGMDNTLRTAMQTTAHVVPPSNQ